MGNLENSSIQVLLWIDKAGTNNAGIVKHAIADKRSVSLDEIHLSDNSQSEENESSENDAENSDEESNISESNEDSAQSHQHIDITSELSIPHPTGENDTDSERPLKKARDRNYRIFGDCHISFSVILEHDMLHMDTIHHTIISYATGTHSKMKKRDEPQGTFHFSLQLVVGLLTYPMPVQMTTTF